MFKRPSLIAVLLLALDRDRAPGPGRLQQWRASRRAARPDPDRRSHADPIGQ